MKTKPAPASAFVTVREAAALIGASKTAIYRLVRGGHLPHAGLPNQSNPTILIPRPAVEGLIRDLTIDADHSVKPLRPTNKRRHA